MHHFLTHGTSDRLFFAEDFLNRTQSAVLAIALVSPGFAVYGIEIDTEYGSYVFPWTAEHVGFFGFEAEPVAFELEPLPFCLLSAALPASSFVLEGEPLSLCLRSPSLPDSSFFLEVWPLFLLSSALRASFFALQITHSLISFSTVLGGQGATFMITRSMRFRQNGKGHSRVSLPFSFLTILLMLLMQ